MTTGPEPVGRYAVLFRTHVWDDYVARQYRRLVAQVRGGDVFVLLDETNGRVPVTEGCVFSHTQASVKALGLADAGSGNMLWYNGDYPLYAFYDQHPAYPYYVMVEYDVAVHGDVDGMVERAAREQVGLVSLTRGESVAEWPHTASCLDAYAIEDVKKRLICFSIFSRDAVRTLFERRLSLSRDRAAGVLQRWPFCEGFIPTELALRGFRLAELTEFGSADLYDWRPAVAESDLATLQQQTFLHPVLDEQRYVQATMKGYWSTKDVLNPRSDLVRKLRRVPLRAYGPPLAAAVRRRVAGAIRRRLVGAERAALAPKA